MIHIKAPNTSYHSYFGFTVFLGGSIEQGKAELWQDRLAKDLESDFGIILNPRRDNWDSNLPQDPKEGTTFYEQVTWELDAQDFADLIVYYFDPATTSPITLLELGAYGTLDAQSVVVCCPKEYFRYGNVAIFCKRHGITHVETYDELLAIIKERADNDFYI